MAYTLTGEKSGTIRFEQRTTGVVSKESEKYSSTVTKNPIEQGAEINDHVNNASGTLNIAGTIIGGNDAINALKAMRANRDLITYVGITRMNNLVFTSLEFDRSYKNNNGADFTATLQRVQIVAPEAVPSDADLPMTSQDAGKSGNQMLAVTAGLGLAVVAVQTVSAASATRYGAAYTQPSSSAPLTRQTGSYSGLSSG